MSFDAKDDEHERLAYIAGLKRFQEIEDKRRAISDHARFVPDYGSEGEY